MEDATAEVVEPLLPFLEQEKLTEKQQRLLIQTCVDELRPFSEDPKPLFEGSLDGQKIFDKLYEDRKLPQAVTDEGLTDVYALLCPRIATLLCKIPAAVKEWENQAWTESFKRLDELAADLRAIFVKVDALSALPLDQADTTLSNIRRTSAQTLRFELDLTCLRSDRPNVGKFDDFFVHPLLTSTQEKKTIDIGAAPDCFQQFIKSALYTLVIGGPGAGKSTWSRWFQREALSEHWGGLPVRVELRRLKTGALPSLHSLVREAAGPHLAEETTGDRIREWLTRNQIIFILDGFDEIHASRRDAVMEWITELRLAASSCPIILTSRPLTTNHLDAFGKSWRPWQMQPFDETRIIDYIERWYRHTPLMLEGDRQVDAKDLAGKWRSDPTIEPLTGNPLLLSTLLMVHHLDGSLPAGRSQLYRRYVEGMLGLWDDRRKVSAANVALTLEQKRQILRSIALHLQFQGEENVEEATALDIVRKTLHQLKIYLDADAVLSVLRERTGLIVGPGIYSFVHKSVAEYLVAETVAQGDQKEPSGKRMDRLRLFEHHDDDKWNTITFLWAGLAPVSDLESFIETCNEAGDIHLGYGILHDQYDRFTPEFRRRVLLDLIRHNTELPTAPPLSHFWIYGHPANVSFKLNIPLVDLRGLGFSSTSRSTPTLTLAVLRGMRAATLGDLLSKAAHEGIVCWSDIHDAEGKKRDLWWMTSIANLHNLEAWRKCIRSAPPSGANPTYWRYWVAETIFWDFIKGQIANDIDIRKVVNAYRESCSDCEYFIPIALMSALLQFYGERQANNQIRKHNRQRIIALIQILAEHSEADVPSSWLAGTSEWNLRYPKATKLDLLAEFKSYLKQFRKEGCLQDDAVYEGALGTIARLRERRDAV
ncbi:MAG: NACHT domain-containing protein [Gammaproteobacteria bacterium]|nr:NACHT domain-containing protein [Gammaproteobacteria bacterium]